MGKTEKRELISRLILLLRHLLEGQVQPDRRGPGWEATITLRRDDLADHLNDNPSLTARLPDAVASAYRKAVTTAHGETGLPRQAFQAVCFWSCEQLMDMEFWPDRAG